jgi:4-hydroxybutyrate CoA-transferase
MPVAISPHDLPALLPPGACVYVQAGIAQPNTLIEALQAHGACAQHFVTAGFPGINEFAPDDFGPLSRATVFYATRSFARGLASGRIQHLPIHQSGIASYLERVARPEVLLIQTSPPDEHGECSLGGGPDFVPLLTGRARLIVAEINSRLPRAADGPSVPWSRLTHVCSTARSLPEVVEPPGDPVALRVAQHAAALIEDGDCLQAGIGTLPAVVLGLLGDRRRLGIHTGIAGEAISRLIERGAATGEHKPAGHPRAVTAHVTGTGLAWRLVEQGSMALRTPAFTHSAGIIGEIDRFVSLGAALEVDLYGQVNAEHLDGKPVSGVGGLVDFARGARLSKGGRAIVMLPSTSRGRSRIRAALAAGTPVTCARADVDIVVTEHGVARLRDLSVHDRARRLLDIADPAHRDALAAEWERLQH